MKIGSFDGIVGSTILATWYKCQLVIGTHVRNQGESRKIRRGSWRVLAILDTI